jgi:GcrA cell cycle regulator
MSWNQQKVEDLKKLWNDGVATSRIGEQLGFTKNAVIGKAFRLGLERRQNSRKKISQPASFSSTTLYRETSSSSSSISVKKEPIRRREKFSFKKSIVEQVILDHASGLLVIL